MVFGTNNTVDFTEISTQDMPEKEQERVESLVLRGGRGPMLDDQGRKEAANLLVAEFGGGSAAHKGPKSADPKTVGFKGPAGVIAEPNGAFQVAEFVLPRGSLCSRPANG